MEALFDFLTGASHKSMQMALNGLLLGTLLTGLAWLIWRRAKNASAATGYAVWWAVLGCIVLLPLLMVYYPAVTNGTSSLSSAENTLEVMESEPVHSETPVEKSRTGAVTPDQQTASNPAALPLAGSPRTSTEQPTLLPVQPETTSYGSLILGLLPLSLLIAWLAVSGHLMIRLIRLYRQMTAIKRTAIPYDVSHLPRLDRMLALPSSRRKTRVCLSDKVDFPVAAGLGDPVVLIPRELADCLSDSEMENAVLHELAHIRRWDDWTLLAQKLIEALAFFHPAVRWIGRQLDLQREIACDDAVVEQTGRPEDYARCLTRLAQLTTSSGTALVPGALSSRKQIFQRFHRILNRKSSYRTRLSRAGLITSLTVATLTVMVMIQVVPVIAVPMEKVSFSDLSRAVGIGTDAETTRDTDIDPATDDADLAYEPLTESISGAVETSSRPSSRTSDRSAPRAPEAPRAAVSVSSSTTTTTSTTSSSAGSSSEAIYAMADWEDEDDTDDRSIISRAVDWAEDAIDGMWVGTQITRDGDNQRIVWSDGHNKLKVEISGEIELSDDDSDIVSISRRGYISIYEKNRKRRMELEIDPGKDGTLQYAYWVNGRSQEFDDEGREWLGEVLIDVIYKTGLGADKRVKKILAREGVDGVLDEIDQIESSWISRLYFEELINSGELTDDDFSRVLKMAGRQIDSDYEKAELLIAIAEQIQNNQDLIADYVEAVETLDSDYETRRVLSEISIDRDTPRPIILAVLEIADLMDSDYEKAELMISLARYSRGDPELSRAYIAAVKDIDSDYETRRVLKALGTSRNLDAETVADLLAMAQAMDSDYEKAELLIELSDLCEDDTKLQLTLLRASATLDSDYEMRRVLSANPFDCRHNPEFGPEILSLIQRMDSDYEKAEMLIDMTDCAASSTEGRRQFLEATSGLDSDYESKRVLQILLEDEKIDEEGLLDILRIVENMDSDYEKGEVLGEMVSYCQGNDLLEEAFVDCIETMDSDYEIDKMYAKLYRNQRRSRDSGR